MDAAELRALRSGQRRLVRWVLAIGAACAVGALCLIVWSEVRYRGYLSTSKQLVGMVEVFRNEQGRLPSASELRALATQGESCGNDIEREGNCFFYTVSADRYYIGWATGIETGVFYDSATGTWHEDTLIPIAVGGK